jgi:hypothetical protein
VRVATTTLLIAHDLVARSDSKELHNDSGKLPMTLFDAEGRPAAALTVGAVSLDDFFCTKAIAEFVAIDAMSAKEPQAIALSQKFVDALTLGIGENEVSVSLHFIEVCYRAGDGDCQNAFCLLGAEKLCEIANSLVSTRPQESDN